MRSPSQVPSAASPGLCERPRIPSSSGRRLLRDREFPTHLGDFHAIGELDLSLRELVDDCRYWIKNNTYDGDEIATRFHHKLVWIHPYPNGNGRHARLATDLLLKTLDRERFSWGGTSLVDPGETRKCYVTALQSADKHDIGPLLEFVRTSNTSRPATLQTTLKYSSYFSD